MRYIGAVDKDKLRYGFLHNRKTAGTALKHVVGLQKERTPLEDVFCFGHSMTFPRFVKYYPNSKAIFFVREPISRFVSGFYSRFRQGKPRFNNPWNAAEAKAFSRFQTPNQLAEALSSKNLLRRWYAISAMRSINHVRHTYLKFLGSVAFLKKHANKIAYIGSQPSFSEDLIILRAMLKIDEDIASPNDETLSHRTPAEFDKYLSPLAIKNLEKWYRADFKIYHWCMEQRTNSQ
jgi:hypothetical protein